jgi:tetraprenyl-beta-curcumene synthase
MRMAAAQRLQTVERRGQTPVLDPPAPVARTGAHGHGDLALGLAFCATVASHLVSVLPVARRELGRWRARAGAIPDPVLRSLAADALSKRGNIEGAALFGVLAPRSRRRETVRALVALQTAYNYLDTLAEQPSADPLANGRQLHQALCVALADPGTPIEDATDYYAFHPQRDDGGFLAALVGACRATVTTLPSYAAVAPTARAAVERIVGFQSLNLTERQGGHDALERWASLQTPPGTGLRWWQSAAAAGSSLAVHALIAMAARPALHPRDMAAIDAAYFPWVCALHSLLDSLVDVDEDEREGQRNLLSYHASPQQAAAAMELLAKRAAAAARGLADSPRHAVIVTAMAAYYLSSPEASAPAARAIAENVAGALGPLARPALALFRARRLAMRLTHSGGW